MIIHIGHGQYEFIEIEILRRSHPSCHDFWDGNWITCRVRASGGGFTAIVEGYLRIEDLEKFRAGLHSLYQTLSGKAKFTTMEDWLSIDIVGDGLGHMSFACVIEEPRDRRDKLEVTLYIDQTFLPKAIDQLDAALKMYPIRGTRRQH